MNLNIVSQFLFHENRLAIDQCKIMNRSGLEAKDSKNLTTIKYSASRKEVGPYKNPNCSLKPFKRFPNPKIFRNK